MSSSASLPDFPNWDVFSGRAVVITEPDFEPGSFGSEMNAVLQTFQSERRTLEEQHARERQWRLEALVGQALLVGQLEIVLRRYDALLNQPHAEAEAQGQISTLQKTYRSFRIQKEQMLDALAKTGIRVDIPQGKSYSEVENVVEVEGWRHHQEYTHEIVIEVREPVVHFNGTLVHLGKVIMGGPIEPEDKDTL